MTTKTELNLEEIEARAKVATQGTWKFSPWHIQEGPPAVLSSEAWVLATTSSDSNAAHIAGMDPSTTLALTAALRKAWKELDEARDALKAEVEYCRPEVRSFARQMEDALRRKDGERGGNSWQRQCLPEEILPHLQDRAEEIGSHLKLATKCRAAYDDMMEQRHGDEAARDAVHAANFAMMIADICGCVDRHPALKEPTHD